MSTIPKVSIDLHNPPSTLRVSVDEPIVWVDRNLQTASWWDRYEIQTCTAEVRFTTINHSPFVPGHTEPDPGRFVAKRAYYAMWTLDAYLVEEYRENRFLSATSASTRKTREHTTVTFRCYAYELQALLDGERQFSRPGRLWSL